MDISTFGSGNMARVIGGAFASVGHRVMIGSRDPEKASSVANEIGLNTIGGSNDDAADFGEVIIHTVRAKPSVFLASTSKLRQKIIVDVNNRDFPRKLDEEPLFPSLIRQSQEDAPDARFVKCFNTLAMEVFHHEAEILRTFGVSVFVAGADENARQTVSTLAREIGFEPIDLGGPENADIVEIQGDFIRTAIFGHQNPLLTSQIREIPAPSKLRFGKRRPGTY